MNPLQVPQQGPCGENCLFTRPIYISLKFLIKISLNKETFPFFQMPQERASLHAPQKRGPYGNRRPFLEPYFAYPSGSLVKKPSLQVPLIELPRRKMSHPLSPHSFIFKVPSIRAYFQVPQLYN